MAQEMAPGDEVQGNVLPGNLFQGDVARPRGANRPTPLP